MNIATRSRILDNNTDSESTEVRSPPPGKMKSPTHSRSATVPPTPASENGSSTTPNGTSLFTSLLPLSPWSSKPQPQAPEVEQPQNSIFSPIHEAPEDPKSDLPVSLEGTLFFRKCKSSSGSKYWKQVYVVLNLTNEGSLACYLPNGESNKKGAPFLSDSTETKHTDNLKPKLHLPPYVNWVAKDIENNASGFVIEVNTIDPVLYPGNFTEDEIHTRAPTNAVEQEDRTDSFIRSSSTFSSSSLRAVTLPPLPKELQDDIQRARDKDDNFRIYFKCGRSGNEKVLWLRAFEQVDRLSYELHRQRGIIATLANPNLKISHSRMRSHHAKRFALEGKVLDDHSLDSHTIDDPGSHLRERTNQKGGEKEYMVYPLYAYPNRWMTDAELYAEMLKPSEVFHDTRISSSPQKEIGLLKVELLQCIGLPPLDFASETDATAYMVCGSHAFTTDVIWNRLNPMWLPRSRRACIFPLYHAYARLYVGIFDDDGKGEKDDFAGRVVLDLARCRPRSTYDVTLPLRLSAHVYSRRPRGSVRLRFSLEWYSERDALLSYIPKKIRPPTNQRPDDDVTVLCADEKAFRNIVTTVHGIHMPGRFSFSQWKAVMREIAFARKTLENVLRRVVIDIVIWKNPSLSMLVFSSWMHVIYRNSFALVPLHIMSFMTLMMVRTYVFFGTDGPIQNGFIPPSWEEMAMALLKSGEQSKVIKPLKVKPFKPVSRRGSVKFENSTKTTEKPETHQQYGKWIFRLLGFKTKSKRMTPEDYHMEFPFSQGLRNPINQQTLYPKFRVKESLVSKSSVMSRKGKSSPALPDDGDENMLGDLWAIKSPSTRRKSFSSKFSKNLSGSFRNEGSNEGTGSLDQNEQFDISARSMQSTHTTGSSHGEDDSAYMGLAYEDLPPSMRLPEQNIDAKGTTKKKKLADELMELQQNMHKLTFHIFNDRTHVIRHPDPVYFGQANKAEWFQKYDVEYELERLLNIGQFSSANPVVARVGTYVEPIIHASISGLGLYRALYNIATWRDPMLSFWVSLAMATSVLVLAIFPWRLFFFVVGLVLVGPQNWVIRLMEKRGTTPLFIKKRLDKFITRKPKKKAPETTLTEELPLGQPVIGSHTSDNTQPATYSPEEVDASEIHQVSVPYSQLMTQRFYDWPPEPQYSKCEPYLDAAANAGARKRQSFGFSRQMANRQMNGNNSFPDGLNTRFDGLNSPDSSAKGLGQSLQRRTTG